MNTCLLMFALGQLYLPSGDHEYKPSGDYAKSVSVVKQKPIVFGHPWVETATHSTSDKHLIEVHGFTTDQLRGLSQDQKNRLHGGAHETVRVVPIQSYSSCPGGVCPTRKNR